MTPEEAKAAYAAGDYAEAVATLRAIADKEPRNTSANTMAGIALLRTGNTLSAQKYLQKGTNDAKIALAEICFLDYDFDGADEWLEKYSAAQKKARKPESDEAEALRSRIETGRAMLDRVEKIIITDSITVPRDDFLKPTDLLLLPANNRCIRPAPRDRSGVTIFCICYRKLRHCNLERSR